MQDLQDLVNSLKKRRIVAICIVILFAILALFFNHNYEIQTPMYFDGIYNISFSNGLICYKLVEIIILYYILFHRYIISLKRNTYDSTDTLKLKKHTKLLLFLIPQGNTVFGIIAYKFGGSVLYFLLFSVIALVSLILVKPNKLIESNEFQNLN